MDEDPLQGARALSEARRPDKSVLILRIRRHGRTSDEVREEVRRLLAWMDRILVNPPGEASAKVARQALSCDSEVVAYLRGYELLLPPDAPPLDG